MADEVSEQKEKEFKAACKKLGLPVTVSYAPFQDNVPDVEMTGGKPKGLTIHETGNFNAKARAMSQRNYVANNHGGGPKILASFTMSVDDGQVVLICRLNFRNNHAGKALGNATHGSIEICVNVDRDADKTNDNAAKAAAAYLFIWGLDRSVVVQHNIWYGKDCPMLLRRHGWGDLLMSIDKHLATLKDEKGPEKPAVRQFPQTGHVLYGEFKTYFEGNGDVEAFGFPITDTTQENISGTVYPYVQWFERARMEWHEDVKKVLLGRVGAELVAAKGRPVDPAATVADRFAKYYEKNGGVEIFGLPLEGERLEELSGQFYHIQYFERARLEADVNTGNITRGRVGAEAREAIIESVPDSPAAV
ncbi:MAG TPA: N-acetylmuramoyl-L-alanine amidase [Chloroflexia bacterium]|nr:N-acetylmuramoyl-L-alanine amidase [Chloroflexia bacterium]